MLMADVKLGRPCGSVGVGFHACDQLKQVPLHVARRELHALAVTGQHPFERLIGESPH